MTISRPNLGRVWKGAHGVHGKLAQHPGANMYSRVGWGSSERPWMEERIEAETSVSLKITTPLWCICDGDWLWRVTCMWRDSRRLLLKRGL